MYGLKGRPSLHAFRFVESKAKARKWRLTSLLTLVVVAGPRSRSYQIILLYTTVCCIVVAICSIHVEVNYRSFYHTMQPELYHSTPFFFFPDHNGAINLRSIPTNLSNLYFSELSAKISQTSKMYSSEN